MKCTQCRKKLIDYITGQGEKSLINDIKLHLKECDLCNQEAKRLKKVWKKLGYLPEEEPSPELRTQFYSMLDEMTAKQQNRESWITRIKNSFKTRTSYHPVPRFGFALLFLTVGLILGHFITSQRIQYHEISQLKDEVHTMHQMISLTLLEKNESVERLKGITYINRISNPEKTVISALINTLNSDPNVNVRLAAVDALNRFLDYNHIREKIEQSLIQQTSPLVQISLIDLIAKKGNEIPPEIMNYLLKNKQINPAVQQYAEKTFKNQI